jgi:hypothetical protein
MNAAPRLSIVARVDRDVIAREQRRRQALEALEFERERAAALLEQLETLVTELEAPRIDEATFARMAPEDVEVVRSTLDPAEPEGPEEEWLRIDEESWEPDPAEREAEIARLEEEIASSRRRQEAFEHYIEALGN